jgi:hypothetical protein
VSRKALLKRQPKAVEINGETVYVRSLTMREALHVDELSKTDAGKVPAYMVACAVVDAAGVPLFTADDPELDDMPIETIRQLGEVIKNASAPGSVEKAVKN